MQRSPNQLRLTSIRPLVRYVDEERAVIDVRVSIESHNSQTSPMMAPVVRQVHLLLEIKGEDGFRDEQEFHVPLRGDLAVIRYELICPQRWWPAGMGCQPLYQLSVSFEADPMQQAQNATVGLTSVRPIDRARRLLVNGQECPISQILAVDAPDEQGFVPMAWDSLVLIRGHYGPDVLYDAADRAGILMVQAVPIHPQGQPESEMADQVDRLLSHPSLAGWFVGHLGFMTERIAYCVSSLDPTRNVFRAIPGAA